MNAAPKEVEWEDMLHDLRVQMMREELIEALTHSKSPAEMRQRQLTMEQHWAHHLELLGRLAVEVAEEFRALLLAPREMPQ